MLDLFSGIGGFALAAKWVWGKELDIVGFCDIEEYCHKVLAKNFPNVPIYKDICDLDGADFDNIDLITGGFPCTDISQAGKGKGLVDESGKRTRSGLWFEMHRIISEIRPRFALIENVPMLTARGGTRVIADLAQIGYNAEWTIIGADDVGAWHRRKRIWIVAYPEQLPNTNGVGCVHGKSKEQSTERGITSFGNIKSGGTYEEAISNADSRRFKKQWKPKSVQPQEQRKTKSIKSQCGDSKTRQKIKSGGWRTEPKLGRVAHGIPNRVDRLKGLGNAIVPQVAQLIMEKLYGKI
jgi:DNA (cytosine-5)-methyltransferase 1